MEQFELCHPTQCAKCPWKCSTNPYDIPNYDIEQHKALESTIATDLEYEFKSMSALPTRFLSNFYKIENMNNESERKNVTFVYAGRRRELHVYYELLNTVIGDERAFKTALFTDKTIGCTFDLEEGGKNVYCNSKQRGSFKDFENRQSLVQEWRLEDSLVAKSERAKKDLKEIHRYESFRNFKNWYQTKSPIEQQYLLSDLVTFLNNKA